MPAGGRILNVSSDAAVEPYEGWGGYGASKAALEQLTRVLAAERPELRIYSVDPGDMRTRMHQDAFPGEDISDRPPPEESVPGLLELIEGDLPSGRYAGPRAGRGARVSLALAAAARGRLRRPRSAGLGETTCACSSPAAPVTSSMPGSPTCRGCSSPGDLLAINTSATLPAAVSVRAPEAELRLHLSGPAPEHGDDVWRVELRRGGERHRGGRPGQVLLLPAGGTAVLLEASRRPALACLACACRRRSSSYLARHGEPIRYRHAERAWPLERYQTVYATEPGSAEMPSAGRAFTPRLITRLVAARHRRGAARAPHRGVLARGRRDAARRSGFGFPASPRPGSTWRANWAGA